MALYAIGDLHLAFQADKSMEWFGELWKDHPKKIAEKWMRVVKEDDTVVITGDVSWGRNLGESQKDLEFIASLPGRKILLRGNHDRYWQANKTRRLNEMYKDRLCFLQNNFYAYGEYALIGTKGFCLEEWDRHPERAEGLFKKELQRLRKSYDQAKDAGYTKFIMFLHYPPTNTNEEEGVFRTAAEALGVEQVVYSHLHGEMFNCSIKGNYAGIEYRLVSADYVEFEVQRVLG